MNRKAFARVLVFSLCVFSSRGWAESPQPDYQCAGPTAGQKADPLGVYHLYGTAPGEFTDIAGTFPVFANMFDIYVTASVPSYITSDSIQVLIPLIVDSDSTLANQQDAFPRLWGYFLRDGRDQNPYYKGIRYSVGGSTYRKIGIYLYKRSDLPPEACTVYLGYYWGECKGATAGDNYVTLPGSSDPTTSCGLVVPRDMRFIARNSFGHEIQHLIEAVNLPTDRYDNVNESMSKLAEYVAGGVTLNGCDVSYDASIFDGQKCEPTFPPSYQYYAWQPWLAYLYDCYSGDANDPTDDLMYRWVRQSVPDNPSKTDLTARGLANALEHADYAWLGGADGDARLRNLFQNYLVAKFSNAPAATSDHRYGYERYNPLDVGMTIDNCDYYAPGSCPMEPIDCPGGTPSGCQNHTGCWNARVVLPDYLLGVTSENTTTHVSGIVVSGDGSADSIDVATYGTDYIVFRAGSYFSGEHEFHFRMTGEHTSPPSGTEVRMMVVGYNSASGLLQERDEDIVFVESIPVDATEASVTVSEFGRSIKSVVIGICLVEDVAQGPLYGSQQHKYFKYEYEYGVSTPASVNVTWDGTVLVLGDRTVPSSRSLTIDPGTEVHVWPEDLSGGGSDVSRIELNVDGHLIVNGTVQNPVLFRSWDGTGKGEWFGIKVTDDTGSSHFEHVVIKNAETGITFFAWPGGENLISDLQIEDCEMGFRNVDAFATFEGISVAGCDIGFSSFGGIGSSLTFRHITATDCGRGFDHTVAAVRVEDGTFVDCDTAIVSWDHLTLRDSVIRNSQLYGLWAKGGDLRVAHCSFRDKVGPLTPMAVRIDSTVSTAELDTCLIQGAETAVQTKSQTTLRKCSIRECGVGVTAPWYPPLTLVNSAIEGTATAVSLDTGFLSGDSLTSEGYGLVIDGPVTCRETHVVGNGDGFRGIDASSAVDELTLREVTVSGFNVGVYLGAGSSGDIDSTCGFSGNDTGVEIYGTGDVTIRGSIFEENETNGIYLHSAGATIEGNTITGSANGIFSYESVIGRFKTSQAGSVQNRPG